MKKIGYLTVFTLFSENDVRYDVPVYNYIGSKNVRQAKKACEEKNNRLATICEEIRKQGYVPEKIAVCKTAIYVSGKRKDNGRTKTVRV